MKRTLLLNSDWSPLNFVSPVRALNLVMRGRAEVINTGEGPSFWGEKINTPNRSFEVPATLRLVDRVSRKMTMPRFRKWVLFNRDCWQCQYCGTKLDWNSITIDHVRPKCMGGDTSWKNCVASCKKCNWKKGSRTLAEAGMQLRKNPSVPSVIHFWESPSPVTWHPDWLMFFDGNSYRS